MLWSEFIPYVMPYVIGCPIPLLENHARMAAIKFATETKCWVRRLEPFATIGDHLIDMDAAAEKARILDFDMVQVDGVIWPIVEPDEGIRMAQVNDGKPFCFSEEVNTLSIHPLQVSGLSVVVRAALVPTIKSTSLDAAMEEHAEAISFGAIASLMRVPNQPFSSSMSDTYEAMFRERIKTESSRLARGRVAVTPRAVPSFM